MKTYKVAAHYMLDPDKGFRQWPLITMSQKGRLLSCECFPNGLKEHPFVQFFSGILIPAFIDVLGDPSNVNSFVPHPSLDRHFARGTLMMALENQTLEGWGRSLPPFPVSGRIMPKNPFPSWMFPGEEDLPIWERMKRWALNHENHNLEQMLTMATVVGAKIAGVGVAGALVAGSFPGVLLLQNADLQNMKISAGSSVRWLSVPKPAAEIR